MTQDELNTALRMADEVDKVIEEEAELAYCLIWNVPEILRTLASAVKTMAEELKSRANSAQSN
jgi:hypothetical protein